MTSIGPLSTSSVPPPTLPLTDSQSSAPMHVPDSFLHQITEKFDDKNFLLWCQQVEPVIKAHQLHHFVVVSQVSLHFLTEQDRSLSG